MIGFCTHFALWFYRYFYDLQYPYQYFPKSPYPYRYFSELPYQYQYFQKWPYWYLSKVSIYRQWIFNVDISNRATQGPWSAPMSLNYLAPTGLGRLRRALVGSQRRFSASTHYWCLRYINAATLSTNLSATCQSPCRPPRWPPRRPPCRPPVRSPRQSPCRPPCRVGKSDINSTDTYLTTKKIAPKTHKLWQIQLCDKTLSSPIDHKNNIIFVFWP